MERWLPIVQRCKYRILLALIVAALIAQPLVYGHFGGRIVHEILLALSMLSLIMVFTFPRERLAALLMALPAVAANMARYALGRPQQAELLAVQQTCTVAFLGFAIFVILRTLFEQRTVTADELIGVFCGYVLAGVAWSNMYTLVELYLPDSFRIGTGLAWEMSDVDSRRSLFNYFSFTTLTTIGFGDVTPKHPLACSLAWLEAAFGQFYVAVVVALLVGAKLTQPR